MTTDRKFTEEELARGRDTPCLKSEKKITWLELNKLFGDRIPMEALDIVWNAPAGATIGEIRAKLHTWVANHESGKTENKYPNADTSAERLRFIQHKDREGLLFQQDENELEKMVRDLLAMLHERSNILDNVVLKNVVKELRQQLHDQRWRRFTEKPETFPIQVMFENLDPIHLYSEQAVPKGVLEKSWWRPIPPLPKE